MKIALDIDGVLLEGSNEVLFFKYCEGRGCIVNYELFAQTHSWNASIIPPDPDQSINDLFTQFFEDVGDASTAVGGSREALVKLQKSYELNIVTARSRNVKYVTQRTLQREFPSVSFASYAFGCVGNKASYVQGCKVLVEDSVSEIEAVLAVGANVRCIQFPSFRGKDPQPRVNDERVHVLEACASSHLVENSNDRKELCESAWREALHVIPIM